MVKIVIYLNHDHTTTMIERYNRYYNLRVACVRISLLVTILLLYKDNIKKCIKNVESKKIVHICKKKRKKLHIQ